MNEQEFRAIYLELMDENPFAARAALKVLHLEFTNDVDTLAVTLEARPRMLVNLDFIGANCARTIARSRRQYATSSCISCCAIPSASSGWTRCRTSPSTP